MIALKDIFKPRYAIVVTLERVPKSCMSPDFMLVPAVSMLALKRPLGMRFNDFYNSIKERYGIQSLVICGSYLTMRGIYGVGSCNKHNIKNAIYMK